MPLHPPSSLAPPLLPLVPPLAHPALPPPSHPPPLARRQWYVDVVLQLIKLAGDQVSEEIWYRVIQIITNQGDELQRYATETVWRALVAEKFPHRTLVKVAGYVLGEFGHMIADLPESNAHKQVEVLTALYANAEPEVRALLLNTFVKLAHSYAEIVPQVTELLTASSSAMDQEIQQRSNEYLALASPQMAEVKTTVLEMMPHFTERESIVQKQLAKSKGEGPVKKSKDDEDDDDDDDAPTVPQPTRAAAPDLIGGLGDEPPPRPATAPTPSGAADLLGGLDLGGPAPAPAPAASAGGLDDLLGLGGMGGAPAPAPAASAGGGLDDLLGLGGMGGAPAPAPAPAAPASSGGAGGMTPQCIALCLRNDGVLHEDANMQIGVKMEFANPPAGHQGRMALYFGNKTAEPFSSFATQLSPSPGLAIQAAAVPNTMQPRAQGQQMLMMECGAAYGEAPQIAVRFVANGAPVQLVLRLPLPASKFTQPLVVDAAEFFRRWKVFDGKEAQQIFKLAAVPLPEPMVAKVLSEGMKLALLKGVDPNPSNFVIAGWLSTKGCTPQGDAESVLMRLEVNDAAGVCRISVRSGSNELNTALSKLIIGQLGKPE